MLSKLVFSILLVLTSCQSSSNLSAQNKNDEPEWLRNRDKNYPASLYLSAIGSGLSKQDAENDALNGISKIFNSSINAQTNTIRNVKENNESIKKSLEMIRNITVSTNTKLLNTSIQENYFRESEKTHYALATMNKLSTRRIYQERIRENNRQVDEWAGLIKNTENDFEKLKYLGQSKELLSVNTIFAEMLKILGDLHSRAEDKISFQDITKERHSILDRLTVGVKTNKNFPKSIKNEIESQLNTFGFKLGKNNPKLIVNCEYEHEETELSGNAGKFINYNFKLSFIDGSSQREIATMEDSGRSGQLSISAARKKAELKVKNKIANRLISFINNDVLQ